MSPPLMQGRPMTTVEIIEATADYGQALGATSPPSTDGSAVTAMEPCGCICSSLRKYEGAVEAH
jgi:hypothetical protein